VTPEAYALLGLTAIVGAMGAALTFAVLRFAQAARAARAQGRSGAESALLATALQDALARVKAQERAMAARAEASERLSDEIIASLSAGLLVVGLGGDVRILNPVARRLLHVPEEASGRDFRALIREASLRNLIEECLTTRQPVLRRTVRLADTAGGASHLGVSVSPLQDDRGVLHGAICLFSDLTAVMRLEEQLRLKESLATVGELTAGIAHEFRNGLATILGYSKLLHLDAMPDADRTYAEGIRAEAESLGRIVTNFLNFAKPAQLTLSRVDVGAVCEHAADEVRAEARALGGEVAVTGAFGSVEGDEVLLRQAIANLLRNAVEACRAVPVPPQIVVASSVDGEERLLHVAVDDNGPGIPPDARERVFRPFYTSKRDGTGLGLALVQKIIVFHNGRIRIESSSLGGARLQITLPLSA
jgi:signal transduction histidine kinase